MKGVLGFFFQEDGRLSFITVWNGSCIVQEYFTHMYMHTFVKLILVIWMFV